MDTAARIKALQIAVESSPTPAARRWRTLIYENIIKYIKASEGDDAKFRQALWLDYLAWATWYFDGENSPIFLTKKQYQMYRHFKKYDRNTWLYQRRAGKSMGTAILVLYYAMTNMNRKVLIFAPTEDQLVLMQNVRQLLGQESATKLYEEFIGAGVAKGKAETEDDTLNKLGAVFNQKHIRFLNGTDITAVTLNVKGGGSTRRGFSANLIVADEFQDIPPEIRGEIIEPIIMDAFSDDKRLIYIGTPHTKIDPKLDLLWENSKASPHQGTLHSHCWEAVEEGVRKPAKMADRFRSLEIPCRWVLETGICPVFLPQMYNEAVAKHNAEKTDPYLGTESVQPMTAVEIGEDGRGKVPCGKICMENPTFVQEDMAMFPHDYGLGIPPEWVKSAGRPYPLTTMENAKEYAGQPLVMSIDYGDIRADTQICLWVRETVSEGTLTLPRLRLIYQEIVNDPQIVGVRNPSAQIIKKIYHAFLPKSIIVDVTGKKEQIMELIVDMRDGLKAIPSHLFYSNEAAQKNNVPGFWFSGPEKAKLFDNLKEQLRLSKIIVPNTDLVLWEKFFSELISLKPQAATMSRTYVYWGVTMHLTDAVALAAWLLKDDMILPAFGALTHFDLDGNVRDDDDY